MCARASVQFSQAHDQSYYLKLEGCTVSIVCRQEGRSKHTRVLQKQTYTCTSGPKLLSVQGGGGADIHLHLPTLGETTDT